MKILLATYWYLPHVGGVSTYVYNLRRELERMGHEVDIFATHPDMHNYYMPNNGRYLEKQKVKEIIYDKILDFYNEKIPQVDPWIRWREIERYSYEAAALVFGLTKYDLIHTQDIISTRALWRVKPKYVPLISTIHGCLATEYLISGEVKGKDTLSWDYAVSEEYYGVTSSDITIVPTRWLKNLFVKDFKVPREHVTIIPYGMDIDSFIKKMDQPNLLDRTSEKTLFACPGRLVPVKGHKYLLYALAKLKAERSDWFCWLIGDGELRKELEQLCKQLGLDEHVAFLGNRSDIPSLLKQADIMILPSLQDNQPFAVMEAQIAGKPVVVSDAGGIPEMVEHGKTGLLSPAGQVDPLYENLRKLLKHTSYRKELGDKGKKWGMVQWSLKTMMDRTLDVYNKLLERQKEGSHWRK